MIPYFLLIGIPALMSLATSNHDRIGFRRDTPIRIFFLIFIILLSLRSVECGTDLVNYRNKFEGVNTASIQSLFDLSLIEPGYTLFTYVNKLICNNFQFFLFTCAIVSIVPIAKMYIKGSNHALLTIALFVGIAPFSMFFSGLRQSIAIGLGAICYYYCKKNRIVPFLVFVFLAFLFHQSAVVLLFMYPLTQIKITKKWLLPAATFYVLCLYYKEPIFRIILSFNSKYESRNTISDTGAYTFMVLLLLLTIYSFIVMRDDLDDTSEIFGLRNLLLLSCYFQCFASVNTVVMRLNYYYLIFVPILIPQIIDNCKARYRQVAKLSLLVFIVFFLYWFFKEAYTGVDLLKIFPYIPFWR